MTFDELAKRCEDATGPDRNLDVDIWRMLPPDGSDKDQTFYCPRFTGSMDEAMTLVEGMRGLALHMRSNPDMGGRDWLVSCGSNRSAARSWPLGLCAVGLRDRAKWAPAPRT